jgi:hypothetical protein
VPAGQLPWLVMLVPLPPRCAAAAAVLQRPRQLLRAGTLLHRLLRWRCVRWLLRLRLRLPLPPLPLRRPG